MTDVARVRGAVLARWLVVATFAVATLAACSDGGEASPQASPIATQPSATQPPNISESFSPDQFARDLFDLTNDERADAGLTELGWSDCVAAAAAPRAAVAASEQQLEHEVLVATCRHGAMAGENLSRNDYTPREVVDAWMGSPGHKANLLRWP